VVVEELIPDLRITPAQHVEVCLTDRAEGEVEVWKGNDGFEAYGYGARGYLWAQLPGLGVFRFRENELEVVAVAEAGVTESVIEDAYHRNVLPLVLHLRGYEVLHASAVHAPSGLLVLCGASGTGKSTLAHALSERGYPAWADDAVVIAAGDREMAALGIPFRLRLHGPAVTHFARASGPNSSHSQASGSALHALAILTRQPTTAHPLVEIERLAAAEAFTAILPHAYYFRLSDAARNAVLVDRYLRLASLVPTFEVRYKPGLDHLAGILDAVEERVLIG
jgi:hypothetical protein